jgi:hypothetical protein
MNSAPALTVPGGPAKLIYCIVPDDGTDKRLFRTLRSQRGINSANSVYCRGIAVLQDAEARRGRLPEPYLARLITVIVAQTEADELFEFIYEQARIGRRGGGLIAMAPVAFATPFVLPEDLPEESGPGMEA